MRIVALIAGWIFSILGGLLAGIVAILLLIAPVGGVYAVLYAIYFASTFGLLGVALFFFGRFLKNRAHKMQSTDDDDLRATPFPPTFLLSAKKELS
jgi:hypothetical protein